MFWGVLFDLGEGNAMGLVGCFCVFVLISFFVLKHTQSLIKSSSALHSQSDN